MRREVWGLMIICFIVAFSRTTVIAGTDETMVLQAPDGTVVEIKRDEYGVPHILAETQAAVFFGQGFATAQDRLVQLEQFRRIAEGRLARLAGEAFVEADMWTKTLFYTESERREQFAQLSAEGKEMLEAYRDGINTYLDSMAVNPQKYQPFEVLFLPLLGLTVEPWTVTNSIAIVQFLLRRSGTYGGRELDRLVELQENGQAWFDEHRPINEAGAPTTIPGDGTTSSPRSWGFSGSTVRPEIVRTIAAERQRVTQRVTEAGLPPRLGSFAALLSALKSSSGNAMLLGGPQVGAPAEDAVSMLSEVELACPTLHIGGATFAGIPGVIIGRNASIAWTFTSGLSDNIDTYIDSTQGSSFGKYRHNDAWLDFTVIQDTVLTGASAISFVHYRTIHGPVFGDDLENHQVFSQRYTVWNRELDVLPGFLRMWKATTLAEFEAGVAFIPFSLNLFYAGRDQNIKFWHLGRYQDRTDGVDPRLPHKGDGSEEWRGFIPFESLPAAANPQQGYFANWNQKPVPWWNNGDNIAWAFDNDLGPNGVFDRVLRIDSYVQAIPKLSFDHLKGVRAHLAAYASYEQVLELAPDHIWGENLMPPGQSGFISRTAVRSPHFSDQWALFTNFELKEMIFGDDGPTSVEEDVPVKPTSFVLYQNYPNPFNPSTTITYDVAARGHVSLKIYNLLGREVASLVDVVQEKGRKRVVFDATRFASGVYVYRLSVNSSVQTRKLILLR